MATEAAVAFRGASDAGACRGWASRLRARAARCDGPWVRIEDATGEARRARTSRRIPKSAAPIRGGRASAGIPRDRPGIDRSPLPGSTPPSYLGTIARRLGSGWPRPPCREAGVRAICHGRSDVSSISSCRSGSGGGRADRRRCSPARDRTRLGGQAHTAAPGLTSPGCSTSVPEGKASAAWPRPALTTLGALLLLAATGW